MAACLWHPEEVLYDHLFYGYFHGDNGAGLGTSQGLRAALLSALLLTDQVLRKQQGHGETQAPMRTTGGFLGVVSGTELKGYGLLADLE